MVLKLTDEQRRALHEDGGPVEVRDDESQKVYVLSDAELFHKAIHALRETEDIAAIRTGIADLEAGRVLTLDELAVRIRRRISSAAADQ